eukprot:GFUD01122898.1.p1 GENE.GFUD01122898.1~~GFUD01122898.1.p1  ORF type:complete len:196 (-),score=69.78 GFUD01122898.1:28-573(-)
MGEYTPAQSRPADGGLYPLEEAGTYGKVPKKEYMGKWTGPEPYVRRERKPKIYSSYSISDKCELHSLVMDRYSRGCKLHSSSSTATSLSSRVSRSVSSTPEEKRNKTEKTELGDRQSSLPPSYELDDLEMMSKLKLARELEGDSRDTLTDSEIEMKTAKTKEIFIETQNIIRKNSNTSYEI